MTRLPSIVLVAFVVVFAFVHSSFASPRTDVSAGANVEHRTRANPAVRLTKDEDRLVKAVNDYREKIHLEPLAVDATLMKVARQAAPCFSHCINGKWCWHRAHEAGFTGWATDDIACGYESPEDAVQGWSTSDGHARQMRGYFKMNGQWCNYKFNRIGVGICGRKYIAVFGRAEDKKSERTKSEINLRTVAA